MRCLNYIFTSFIAYRVTFYISLECIQAKFRNLRPHDDAEMIFDISAT